MVVENPNQLKRSRPLFDEESPFAGGGGTGNLSPDASERVEEMPLFFATPRKRQRLSSIIDSGDVENVADTSGLRTPPPFSRRLSRFDDQMEIDGSGGKNGGSNLNSTVDFFPDKMLVESKIIDKRLFS
jgi:hypothetical protein